MILPIGHEGTGVRRLPLVTFAIILINIIVFLFTNGADKSIQQDLKDASIKVITYYVKHPYLKFNFFGPENTAFEYKDSEIEKWANLTGDVEVPDMDTLDDEQVHLDLLISKLKEIRNSHPFWKYGLISTNRTPVSLLLMVAVMMVVHLQNSPLVSLEPIVKTVACVVPSNHQRTKTALMMAFAIRTALLTTQI